MLGQVILGRDAEGLAPAASDGVLRDMILAKLSRCRPRHRDDRAAGGSSSNTRSTCLVPGAGGYPLDPVSRTTTKHLERPQAGDQQQARLAGERNEHHDCRCARAHPQRATLPKHLRRRAAAADISSSCSPCSRVLRIVVSWVHPLFISRRRRHVDLLSCSRPGCVYGIWNYPLRGVAG